MPLSWSRAGVKVGDSVVKIATIDIDGTSLSVLAKKLAGVFDTSKTKSTFIVRSKESKSLIKLEAEFEKDQSAFTIEYP